MYKDFTLLLGMFLGAYVSTTAQTVAPQIVTTQGRLVPITTMVRALPAPLLARPLVRPENSRESSAHFSDLVAGTYDRDQGLEYVESPSQMREVKTLFSTQSSLPLVHLGGGRFQFDGFTSTLDMQNVQLGPSAAGGLLDFRPRRQNYPGEPRSIDLYGLSLSFHLGRNAQTGRPAQIWRNLARIFRAVR